SPAFLRRAYAVLARVSPGYPPLLGRFLRVTHPSATRQHPEGPVTVRLACVRHAASVQSEPGSNSSLYNVKTCELFRADAIRRLRASSRGLWHFCSCERPHKLLEIDLLKSGPEGFPGRRKSLIRLSVSCKRRDEVVTNTGQEARHYKRCRTGRNR